MVNPPLHHRNTMLLALLLACLSTFGQVNQVLWSQGKPLYANPVATIDSITYGQMLSADTLLIVFDRQSIQFVYDTTENPQANQVFYDTIYVTDTILIQPEYVDLGLSVKWATFNIGATSPEDYGDYFAWGETQPKEEYSLANYKWEISGQYIKYNATDGKERLKPEDDAAYIHWGDNWRMPNDIEYQELIDKCSWEWTTINNINGYRIMGPNGNSIFFPAASYKGVGPNYPIGEYGLYWSQTLNTENCKLSNALFFTPTTHHIASDSNRYLGRTIRPVYDNTPKQ